MFNSNTSADTKIAVLEERLSSYELMMKKIDEAIQIMGKTSQNISKMLAVHEEKLDQCTKADDLLSKLISEMKEEGEEHCSKVSQRIDKIEEEVKEISKIKWMTIGCGIILAALVTAFSSLLSGWWTPSEMQMLREGHTHQQNVSD
jgi:uncharacterized protein YicC (UPF0701 family)